MSDTVILRRKVNRDFTVLDNKLIRDKRLSWKALGLLVYLLSLPDDFRLRLSHLAKQKANGRDATRSGLKELEMVGYLTISLGRDENGKFSATTWLVTDTPEIGIVPNVLPCSENPNAVKPTSAKPVTDKPDPGKPTLLNTNTEQEQKILNTTTTKSIGLCKATTLIFPSGILKTELDSLQDLLAAIEPPKAQLLLDELDDAIRSKVIKTTPLRWFHGLLKKFHNGEFHPGNGGQVASRREKIARLEESRGQVETSLQRQIDDDLLAMSDENFELKHRNIPPEIRNRLARHRDDLKALRGHQ